MTRYIGPHNRRIEDQPGAQGAWLVTFTDTIALLLTFFVLTFAMSRPASEAWDDLSGQIHSNFNRHYGGPLGRGDQDTISIGGIRMERALDLTYLEQLMRSHLASESDLAEVVLVRRPRALVLSLPLQKLFEEKSSALRSNGTDPLYALVPILRRLGNRLEIVAPAPGETLADWQGALERAAAISGALQTAGYDRPLTIRAGGGRTHADIVIMEDDGKQVTVYDIGMP